MLKPADKRKHFHDILERRSSQNGFWHGNPHDDSMPAYKEYFQVKDDYELSGKLDDTAVWIMPEHHACWQHPEGLPMFDITGGKEKHSLNEGGVFAECEDLAEVRNFHWPDPDNLDFSTALKSVDRAHKDGFAIMSGMWSPFFHLVADFFGMDNYFVKMYTHPEIVEAVTENVIEFYLEANRRWFEIAGDKIDAMFFGNDFGSQLDLLISPELFKNFVLPSFIKLTEQGKKYGLKIVLHSCGAIDRAIPYLIDAGVDALHPIQALARDMEAEKLAAKYNGKITFIGGVDTQQLLPFGTPQQIKEEVRRLRDLFGPNFIVSPSHEALLPNVSPENLEAMAEAARE